MPIEESFETGMDPFRPLHFRQLVTAFSLQQSMNNTGHEK
jgi:hypothetical protein